MAKVYLPTELYDANCKVVYNDYIRVYNNNNYTSWTDVYFKSDYLLKSGSSNYSQSPVCDNINTYTDNYYYRYDFDRILIMFIIMTIFCIYFPYKLISRILGKWGKL